MTQATWDPSFANGFTLTNSNLTASRASSGSPSTAWLFSTGSLTPNQRTVFEVGVTGAVTQSGLAVGIAVRDPANDQPTLGVWMTYAGVVFSNGLVYADPLQQATLASPTPVWPDTTYLTVAVDLVANQVTFGYTNPAGRTSYSAIDVSAMVATLGSNLIVPFVTQFNLAGTPSVTLNDGTTPFQNTTFVTSLGGGWWSLSGSALNPLVTTPVTWDPNNADDWQLASGNLTATAPNGLQTTAGTLNTLYGLPALPDGVVSYFEVTLNNVATTFTLGVGIGARGANVADTDLTPNLAGGQGPAYSTFIAFYPTGVVTDNGTWIVDPQSAGTQGAANVGNEWGGGPVTIGVLVDLVNDQISFYNGGAGGQVTGPIGIAGIGEQVTYPIVYTNATASPLPAVSINGGATPFALGLPNGAVPLTQAVVGYGRSTGMTGILLAVSPNPPSQSVPFQLLGKAVGGPFSNVNNLVESLTLQGAPTAFFPTGAPAYAVLSALEMIATVYNLVENATAPMIAYLADLGNNVTSAGQPFNVIPPALPPTPPIVPSPPPPGLPPIPPVVSQLYQTTTVSFSDGSAPVIATNVLGTTASVSISANLVAGTITTMTLTVVPANPSTGQQLTFTATGDGTFSGNFLFSNVLTGSDPNLIPAAPPVTITMSADHNTVIVTGIVDNVNGQHTATLEDVTAQVIGAVTYQVGGGTPPPPPPPGPPPPPPPPIVPLTSMQLAISPTTPTQGQPFTLTATAIGGVFSKNFELSNTIPGPPTYAPLAANLTLTFNASTTVATITGLIDNFVENHQLYLKDTTYNVESPALSYTVNAAGG